MSKMHENIYCNTIIRTRSRSAKKNCFRDERGGVCGAVLFASLFLSLVANAVLVYLHNTSAIGGCEPVTNCSYIEDEQNEQNIWIHPKNNKDWKAAHYCPEKNFTEKWVQDKGRFYVFSTDVMNWNRSRERCLALGGDLVIIKSKEKQTFLADKIFNSGEQTLYWIGLSDSHTEGEWLWVNNHLLDNNNFWTSKPDDYKSAEYPQGEDCVVLNGNIRAATWGDVSCLRKERRICEILCS